MIMKKHNVKIIIGWILIILQCMGIFGTIMSGNGFPTGVPGFIGYFSFSIIGVILLVLGYRNKHN